jgi:hypothetical protein
MICKEIENHKDEKEDITGTFNICKIGGKEV